MYVRVVSLEPQIGQYILVSLLTSTETNMYCPICGSKETTRTWLEDCEAPGCQIMALECMTCEDLISCSVHVPEGFQRGGLT